MAASADLKLQYSKENCEYNEHNNSHSFHNVIIIAM